MSHKDFNFNPIRIFNGLTKKDVQNKFQSNLFNKVPVLSIFKTTRDYLDILKQNPHQASFLKEAWAIEIMKKLNFKVQITGLLDRSLGPVILVGNHSSYLDIPLLWMAVPEVKFLSKSEIQYWPLFGNAAKLTGTIFVSRQCVNSKQLAKDRIKQQLLCDRNKIALFPSGTTNLIESRRWNHGIFKIAQEEKIPVQPFRIRYSNKRAAAYIDRDFFPFHLNQLAKIGQQFAEIEFHPQVMIKNYEADCYYWKNWSEGFCQDFV